MTEYKPFCEELRLKTVSIHLAELERKNKVNIAMFSIFTSKK